MEEDRAQADLGIAADIEEAHAPPPAPVQKVPKKRFVGRRTAAGNAKNGAGGPSIEDSGAIQGRRRSRSATKAKTTKNGRQYHSRSGHRDC